MGRKKVETFPVTCLNPECEKTFEVPRYYGPDSKKPAKYCSIACYRRHYSITGRRSELTREGFARARAEGRHIGPPKGRIPWNKGKKCPQLSGERNGMFGRTHTPEIREMLSALASSQLSELTRQRLAGAQAPIKRSDPEYSRLFRIGWRPTRKQALERDGHACQVCGATPKRPNVHHIVPFALVLKHELSNLVTLCEPCHTRVHRGAIALAAGAAEPILKDVMPLWDEPAA